MMENINNNSKIARTTYKTFIDKLQKVLFTLFY